MRAMRVRLVLAFALLATVVGAAVPSMAPEPAGAAASLFPETGVYSQAGPGGDPTIVRSSQVSINLASLDGGARVPGVRGGGATTLTLNLFPGVTLTAVRDSLEPTSSGQGFVWLGHVQGAPQSQVTLVVENGVVAGNIRSNQAYYQIRYVGGGQHAIYEIDPLAFPEETHARLPVREEVLRARAAAAPPVSADSASTIDVMILYTAAAALEAGGGTAMDTQVDLGIVETNTAYANSAVTPRLRLVYKGQVNYTESGTNIDADLVSLQSGQIPNTAALREQYGADIVSLWVGGSYAGVCGVAYVMNSPSAG